MRWRRAAWLVPVLWAGSIVAPSPAGAVVTDGPCSGSASGDFNGDGVDDLAVGVPEEDIGAAVDAGAVNVVYGSAGGLTGGPPEDQFFHQNADGMNGASEAGDRFGACLAVGDFDGDGISDLAIGVPGEDLNGLADAGAINVVYGSAAVPAGLSTATADQLLHQDTSGIQGMAEAGDRFGSALVAGDLNNDGRDELAVGVPFEDIGTITDAGAVNILRGQPATGLTGDQDQLWHQNSAGIEDAAEPGDRFGGSLASGDFNNDNRDDLAVGVAFEDIGAVADAGAVNVLYGSNLLLTGVDDQLWSQDSAGIAGAAEASDAFGAALAAGNFNGDAFDDLAAGAPFEDVAGDENAGAVSVIYGSATRLVSTGNQLLHQDNLVNSDDAQPNDRFGWSLSAGTFDADGSSDLAVGVPFEDVGGGPVADAGAVEVVYGSAGGLVLTTSDFFTQDSANVEDTAEAGDAFGSALSSGDFDGAASFDLAVGVPQEDVAAANDGAVAVFYGFAGGLDPAGATADQVLHQGNSPVGVILDALEANDMFGSAAG